MGWDRPEWAKRSIESLFLEAETAVRAKLQEEEEAKQRNAARIRTERERAAIDAIEERSREAQAVRAAMSSAMGALATSGQLAGARLGLSKAAAEQIIQAASSGQVTWEKAISLLVKISKLDSQAVHQLRIAQEILRLHLGEPSAHITVAAEIRQLDEIDGPSAAQALGGEANLKQACLDLADGTVTPLVERLMEHQLQRAASRERN